MPLKLTAPVAALGLCGASAIATGVYFHVTRTSVDAGTVQDATTPNPQGPSPDVVPRTEAEDVNITSQNRGGTPAAPSAQLKTEGSEEGATETSTQTTVRTEEPGSESDTQESIPTESHEVSTTSDPSAKTPSGSSDQTAIETADSNQSDTATPSKDGSQASGANKPEATDTDPSPTKDTTVKEQTAPSGTEVSKSVDGSSQSSKGDESNQESSGGENAQNSGAGTDPSSVTNPVSETPQQSS